MAKEASSAGHKLGQIIGDWYEQYFAYPVLQKVADSLGLFLDSRFKKRGCRGEKIIWKELDGNGVDYDFVMELGGSEDNKGIPVAFFETFWRRGSRHSKDKARDDSGKLIPMKETFPTARVLGIISAGDFTKPAKELVLSRGIDLFYVEKKHIINAWHKHNIQIDYPDRSSEDEKMIIANNAIDTINKDDRLLQKIADSLIEIIRPKSIESYQLHLISKIGAIPQQYSVRIQSKTSPLFFENYLDVDKFLTNTEPDIKEFDQIQYYSYQVDFFDGDTFYRENLSWDHLKKLHDDLKALTKKMEE